MATTDLVLINRQIDTRDYLPGEFDQKTFADVEKWLKEKYPGQILELLKGAGAEQNIDRTVFKFEYVDPAGAVIPIESSDTVASVKKLSAQSHWIAEPLGGLDV
ncbi:hypothetical protein ANRL3_02541 [Anaerolineae bacterium]|nr:hypothetical protein ANRL3_02541 [Anaerolineae bacterium]